METSVSFLDYMVIGAFFALIIGIGIFLGRKTKSTAQYFGAGKQVPWWLSGISFYMISFSVMAFVMHTELAYKYGMVTFMLSWMAVPAAICSGLLFARRWRRIASYPRQRAMQNVYMGKGGEAAALLYPILF